MAAGKFQDLAVRATSAIILIIVQLSVIFFGYKAIILEFHLLGLVATYEIVRCSFAGFSSTVVKDKKVSSVPFLLRLFPFLFVMSLQYALSGKFLLSLYFGYYINIQFHYLISFLLVMFSISLFIVSVGYDTLTSSMHVFAHSVVAAFVAVPAVYCYSRITEHSLSLLIIGLVSVILNDVMAYLLGRTFGKNKLIRLSPNKTIEGFIGALITVPILMMFIPLLFTRYPLLYCPKSEPFKHYSRCSLPSYYYKKEYKILGLKFKLLRIQVHSFFIGIYASTLAPFMGFLASGFKRFHGIKDFSKLIPGHGGVCDRIDCQTSVAVFLYLYYFSFMK